MLELGFQSRILGVKLERQAGAALAATLELSSSAVIQTMTTNCWSIPKFTTLSPARVYGPYIKVRLGRELVLLLSVTCEQEMACCALWSVVCVEAAYLYG